MGFDVGGYAQEENNINADFSMPMSDAINLAFGFEVREETFTAIAGEPNSFFGAGSSGFRGVEPKNAGAFKRDNVAIYADVEHDISDALLVQYAARYEARSRPAIALAMRSRFEGQSRRASMHQHQANRMSAQSSRRLMAPRASRSKRVCSR
jgi:hypothetical protein